LDEKVASYWKRYKGKGDLTARNLLLKAYAPFVKSIATRMAIGLPQSVQLDDLVSSGVLGLINAIEKYDTEKGVKFETYATALVRGAILDELRSLDWVPRSVRQKARRLEETYSKLEYRLGRPVEDDEVADEMGVSIGEFRNILSEIAGTSLFSLDEFLSLDDRDATTTLGDVVANLESPNPMATVEVDEVKEILLAALERLPKQEQLTIALYYYEKLNLKEIGEVLGVSESRVSQIHTKAILRLRARLGRIKEGLMS
jgi:RNA polymerase sigma factor for flagellar operon FliA